MSPAADKLFPATRHSHTYRQQAQRSFAAELLVPFGEVDARMGGDYASEESREDLARHFGVSEWAIRTLLVNHRRLGREEMDWPLDESGLEEKSR